jgi:hypothetical protein
MNWQRWCLQLEILLWRYGWLWAVLIALLLAGIALNAGWLAHQTSVLSLQSSRLAALKQAQEQSSRTPPPDLAITDDARAAQQLMKVAYAPTEVSTTLQLIQQIARAKGIALTQSEFQTGNEGHGGLRQVQVTLPVRCSYPQLRDFIDTVLRQLPGISLDQVVLKRDNVAQSQADVRLKLSIWVHPQKSGSSPKGATP